MRTVDFLAALPARIGHLHRVAQAELRPAGFAALNHKPAAAAWSALECLEHLNRYGRYYHAALAQALAAPAPPRPEFEFSWLGRKAIESVRPANAKKQKTLARMNPAQSQLTLATVDEFVEQQQALLELVARAAAADLSRRAVPVEFLRLLRLSIADTLEFLLAHQERHVAQALRALAHYRAPAR